jgi:hypothetical protein
MILRIILQPHLIYCPQNWRFTNVPFSEAGSSPGEKETLSNDQQIVLDKQKQKVNKFTR